MVTSHRRSIPRKLSLDSDAGAPGPEPLESEVASEEGEVCWVCGGSVIERHCKIVCQVCGFMRDCSDP
jgi:hypothetical protein